MDSPARIVASDPTKLQTLIEKAANQLSSATSAAEVLDARDTARASYDAAKSAARFAKAKGAHDELIASVHRAQADALEIEAMAKRRLADEYDAAQARGEVAGHGGDRASKVPARNVVPTAAEVGLSRKDVHEARLIRDAEAAQPGIIRQVLDSRLAAGEEPSKAALRRAVAGAEDKGPPPGRRPRQVTAGMTRDGLEQTIAELRSALAEAKVKSRQGDQAVRGLKEQVALLSADDRGAVIAGLQKDVARLRSERFRVEEKAAHFSRQAHAANKEAAQLRGNATVVEKFEAGDPETVARVRQQIIDAVATPRGKGSRANPDYEPSEAWDAATAVSDCANEIADTVDKHGDQILEAFPNNLARARAIAKLLRGRNAINLILGDAA